MFNRTPGIKMAAACSWMYARGRSRSSVWLHPACTYKDSIVIAVYIFTLLHGFLGAWVVFRGGGHNGLRCAQPKIITCSRLIKIGCNNVVLPTLFIVVNNIIQHCWARISPQSGVTMLNNIVDNYEQCRQRNIVASCFYQPSTSDNF